MAVYSILLGAFIFLFILSSVEFLLHNYAIMDSYKDEARHEGAYVLSLIDQGYLERIFAETKENYANTPEVLRREQFTDAYRERCAVLLDDDYFYARDILVRCRETTEMRNILMEFYDAENDRMVVVLDGDSADNAYLPGQWLSDEKGEIENPKEMARIIASDWYMPVQYGAVSGWTATDYMEIRDSLGNPIGYLVMFLDINEFSERMRDFLVVYIPVLIGVLVLAALWVSRVLRKRIIRPVNELADAARSYTSRNKTLEMPEESYFGELHIDTGDEIEELWETIADMEQDVTETLSRIRIVTAEQERMKQEKKHLEAEMEIARSIQRAALPSAFPDRPEFDLYASMTPAKEVGGDFYDFFFLDDDHLALTVADVSGKGVPAALFMMISKQALRNRALQGGRPSEVLSYVNDHLLENNPNEMFVTIWFGILTISTGEILAVNAGHENPVILSGPGGYELFEDPHGLVCGVMEDEEYQDYTFTLPPGGKLFLYTDGVVEAHNEKGELFDLARMKESLNSVSDASPRETADYMLRQVHAFEGAGDQFDDITMLCLWYKGAEKS